jgi:hypothetical protein
MKESKIKKKKQRGSTRVRNSRDKRVGKERNIGKGRETRAKWVMRWYSAQRRGEE